MKNLALANLYMFVIISLIATAIGLDLKKWSSWLYGIYGFLSGFWFGLLRANASLGLELGVLLAFFVMFGGAMVHWHKQRYKK